MEAIELFNERFLSVISQKSNQKWISIIIVFLIILLDSIGNWTVDGFSVVGFVESIVLLFLWGLLFEYKKFNIKQIYLVLYLVASIILVTSLTFDNNDNEFTLYILGVLIASIYFFIEWKYAWYFLIGFEIVLMVLLFIDWLAIIHLPFDDTIYAKIFLTIPLFGLFFAFVVKSRKKQEEQLQKTIEEQNFLLREVHHRAKNNLQMIMGILEMEGFNVTDPECRSVLVNQSNRLKTMSLLHDHLSEIHNLERIDMKAYIESIVEGLGRLCPYTIEARIDSFTAKLQVAVHIALFINEAISNAIKHAYDDKYGGLIECFVDYEKEKRQCHVKIKDYGNKKFDIQTDTESMGMLLIGDIADRFGVSGVEFHNNDGLEVTCSFYVN